LFNYILISLLVSNIFATDSKDTTGKIKNQDTSYRIAVLLTGSYHEHIFHAGDYWKSYFTGGIRIDLPVYIPEFNLHFCAEVGQINKKDEKITDIEVVLASLSVSYTFPLKNKPFYLRPFMGISNMTINLGKFDIKRFITHPMESCENEFGIIGGIEPLYRIKRFMVSLPISGNLILTSPRYYITANISLNAGVTF
jgi:hypothetical protein